MIERTSKQKQAQEALACLRDGAIVAIGGSLFHNKPMSLVREIVRRGVRDLTVVAVTQASIDVDLLVAAGCVAEVRVPYLGLEHHGLALNVRRFVTEGRIKIWDCDETQVIAGMEAAAKDLPSGLTKTGVGTDLPRSNPDFKPVVDAFTGEPMIAVPALRPDVALLHATEGDRWGNLAYAGYPFSDVLIAEATHRSGGKVIASVDEVVPASRFSGDPFHADIAHILVDAVVEAPWGAHPCSSHGNYQYDDGFLARYQQHAREGATAMAAWLDAHVLTPASHDAYLDRFLTPTLIAAMRRDIYARQ